MADVCPWPPFWKKLMLVELVAKASPKKSSFEFLKNVSSSTVTDVPTVDTDWAFLLGAITIIGISAANAASKGKLKIINNFTFYNIFRELAISYLGREDLAHTPSLVTQKSDREINKDEDKLFLKLVRDITSKGFVRSNYKKKLIDLTDVRINLKSKK